MWRLLARSIMLMTDIYVTVLTQIYTKDETKKKPIVTSDIK